MIPGWPYSFVAALEPGRTWWMAILDAVRPGPTTLGSGAGPSHTTGAPAPAAAAHDAEPGSSSKTPTPDRPRRTPRRPTPPTTALRFGCPYEGIADTTYSATTIRNHRDEWITLGIFAQLKQIALEPTTGSSA